MDAASTHANQHQRHASLSQPMSPWHAIGLIVVLGYTCAVILLLMGSMMMPHAPAATPTLDATSRAHVVRAFIALFYHAGLYVAIMCITAGSLIYTMSERPDRWKTALPYAGCGAVLGILHLIVIRCLPA